MKLQNAERGGQKLNGATVESLNRWSPPRGDGQVVGHQGRLSFVKLRKAPEFKKSGEVLADGGHGPSWALDARHSVRRVVPATKHEITKQSQF